jgi:hypothetical protein
VILYRNISLICATVFLVIALCGAVNLPPGASWTQIIVIAMSGLVCLACGLSS